MGAAIYALTFLAGVWLMHSLTLLPPMQPGVSAEIVVAGLMCALVLGPALSSFGTWLGARR